MKLSISVAGCLSTALVVVAGVIDKKAGNVPGLTPAVINATTANATIANITEQRQTQNFSRHFEVNSQSEQDNAEHFIQRRHNLPPGDITMIPECARRCLLRAIAEMSTEHCNYFDLNCACRNKWFILQDAHPCIDEWCLGFQRHGTWDRVKNYCYDVTGRISYPAWPGPNDHIVYANSWEAANPKEALFWKQHKIEVAGGDRLVDPVDGSYDPKKNPGAPVIKAWDFNDLPPQSERESDLPDDHVPDHVDSDLH